ncbi:MAG: bifunctional methylenetetrahydrofolate dehydrogenase/methenyltetrahydrofolate cyclohydrolase FolD [Myxococcota bacterium]|nr:bifunctional methylenetetrahydrofolate dehydrogenase/methenyltetrahydrofolate cyclohydrolase FolD [Myxococcota bacterium]
MRAEVADFQAKTGRAVSLHVVLVGDDPASHLYVRNKARACAKVGIASVEHRLAATVLQAEILSLVKRLNADRAVDGILLQLPMPAHVESLALLEEIDPAKDVDGFHSTNVGRMMTGRPALLPCTPKGCLRLLDSADIPIDGRSAVVVGRSNIVGKPMAMLLLSRNATVTICHSHTQHLAHLIAEADIVVAAVGKASLIKGEWIKSGAAVVDVGSNQLEDGRFVGDVDFETASVRAAWITPVPGGVGPMTIACLLENTVEAAKRRLAGMGDRWPR